MLEIVYLDACHLKDNEQENRCTYSSFMKKPQQFSLYRANKKTLKLLFRVLLQGVHEAQASPSVKVPANSTDFYGVIPFLSHAQSH